MAHLFWGALFGFLLHQARVTDYDTILGLFLLRDFHLMGVMGGAIAITAVGIALLRRRRSAAPDGEPNKPKTLNAGVVAGALIFGLGWALSGACPGTALAQLGEGKLYALATIAGMLLGTMAYGFWRSRRTI